MSLPIKPIDTTHVLSRALSGAHVFGWSLRNRYFYLSHPLGFCPRLADFCTALCDSWNGNAGTEERFYLVKLYVISPLENGAAAVNALVSSTKPAPPTHRVWIGVSSGPDDDDIESRLFRRDREHWSQRTIDSDPPPLYGLFKSLNFAIDRIAFQFREPSTKVIADDGDPATLFVSIPAKRPNTSSGELEWDFDGITHTWTQPAGRREAPRDFVDRWLKKDQYLPVIEQARSGLDRLTDELCRRYKEGILKTTSSVLSESESGGEPVGPIDFSKLVTTAFLALGGGAIDTVAVVYSSARLSQRASGYVASLIAAMTQAIGRYDFQKADFIPVLKPIPEPDSARGPDHRGNVAAHPKQDSKGGDQIDALFICIESPRTLIYRTKDGEERLTPGQPITDRLKQNPVLSKNDKPQSDPTFSNDAFKVIQKLIECEGQMVSYDELWNHLRPEKATAGQGSSDAKPKPKVNDRALDTICSNARLALKQLTGIEGNKWLSFKCKDGVQFVGRGKLQDNVWECK